MDSELLFDLERELEQLGADEFGSHPLEQQQLLIWRAVQFRDLGFDRETATALAVRYADLGRAREIVAAACPLDLAARILL